MEKNNNKFNRSYEKIKAFLRLVSYGCYHRKFFSNYDIKPRSYDEFLRQMRFFIPENNIQVTYYKKNAYFTFVGDFSQSTNNYFHYSFLTKSIIPNHLLQFILILQLLDNVKKPLSLIEIVEEVSETIPQNDENDLLQLVRRRLTELVNAGILQRIEVKGKFCYEKILNPINLNNGEWKILKQAVNFYRSCSLISIPGYLLENNLKYFFNIDSSAEIFQFKNNNFSRILDDDIIFEILQGINENKKILVDRKYKAPITIIPLSIETDFLYNRQYLNALKEDGKNFEPIRLRIDKIKKLKLLSNIENFNYTDSKNLRNIFLKVTFCDNEQRQNYENILNEQIDIQITEEGKNYFICKIQTEDPLQIYPSLWKIQPWAEILSGKDNLRERMKNDVQEALKNYANFI